jgi:hypothetical protein
MKLILMKQIFGKIIHSVKERKFNQGELILTRCDDKIDKRKLYFYIRSKNIRPTIVQALKTFEYVRLQKILDFA